MHKIYYGRAVYDQKEIKAVMNVLKNQSLSLILKYNKTYND